jgi:hypothetical protein
MGIILSRIVENKLKELAELLRALEQTLLRLNETKDVRSRQVFIRKMFRLFSEIERNPIKPKRVTTDWWAGGR